MAEITYQDLIEKRKSCKECQNYGLCDDLNLSHSNGNLYQLENIVKERFPINSLGLWNPANNSNPLTASVLIIGQDFSNVAYFNDINSLLLLNQIESQSETNKNLLKYIELSSINKNEIFFTNAILCIKSGKMNASIKKKWITNCSMSFLKPLILEHLKSLKIIITLGKVALDSINEISVDVNKKTTDFPKKDNFSSIAGNNYTINIEGKELKLYPMFHTGRLGNSNAKRVKKNPTELWEAISL
jgi:uracil-DNA glycosylase